MEWERYKAAVYDASVGWHNECRPLTTVYHVAHVETALRILKDKRVKAGLVFDKSKLNRERILVDWLSPNTWFDGSRYGNIGFEMDFRQLIEFKNYYWVEVMTEYNIHALRILITPHEYPDLVPYDPVMDSGPWRYDPAQDMHYWNATHCLEFMHEGDLMVNQFSAITYYDHHSFGCCIDPRTCPDKKLFKLNAMARFIALVIAHNIPVHSPHFTVQNERGTEANEDLKNAIGYLYLRTIEAKLFPDGAITFEDPLAPNYIQSLLLFYGQQQYEEFKDFVCLFASQEDFRGALTLKVQEKFRLTSTANLNWPPND